MLGLKSPLLSAVPGVSHGFFGRVGGTSPQPWRSLNVSDDVSDAPARVEENVARVRFQLGVARGALFTATQVHGVAVVAVTAGSDVAAVRAQAADGVFTCARGLGVGVRTADCAPVLLAVDDGSGVAALHAGWRGAVGGVLAEGVRALCAAAGITPDRLVAAVGPCIGQSAFEVGPEVIAQAGTHADLTGLVVPGEGDRAHLDLGGLCLRLLRNAGVARAETTGPCTFTDVEGYFSHRRDVTHAKGMTGRQMSAIALTTPPDLTSEAFA